MYQSLWLHLSLANVLSINLSNLTQVLDTSFVGLSHILRPKSSKNNFDVTKISSLFKPVDSNPSLIPWPTCSSFPYTLAVSMLRYPDSIACLTASLQVSSFSTRNVPSLTLAFDFHYRIQYSPSYFLL